MTFVEANFGLRISDSKPNDTSTRGHSDPRMLMQSTLSRLPKDHRDRAIGVLSAAEHIFNETAMHAKAQASNRMAKANRASHGPRVRAKVRVKITCENPKGNPKEPKVRTKVPKAYTRAKTSKAGLSGLENPKSEASSDSQESAPT